MLLDLAAELCRRDTLLTVLLEYFRLLRVLLNDETSFVTAGCSRQGSRIEAASVVVKPTKPYTINRGVPSQTVGWIVCDPHQDVGASVEEGAEGEAGVPGGARRPRRLFSNYGSLYMGV